MGLLDSLLFLQKLIRIKGDLQKVNNFQLMKLGILRIIRTLKKNTYKINYNQKVMLPLMAVYIKK